MSKVSRVHSIRGQTFLIIVLNLCELVLLSFGNGPHFLSPESNLSHLLAIDIIVFGSALTICYI